MYSLSKKFFVYIKILKQVEVKTICTEGSGHENNLKKYVASSLLNIFISIEDADTDERPLVCVHL